MPEHVAPIHPDLKCHPPGAAQGAHPPPEGHYSGLKMPSLFIFFCNVERFIPRRAAAPFAPLTTQPVSRRATRMCSRSASASVSVEVGGRRSSIPLHKAAIDVTPEDWDGVMQTNVKGTFFVCQRFGRHLIDGGRPGCIVNLASTFGVVGYAGVSIYGISKAAIIHMTKMLAVEWSEHGIRVNAVAPGTVETPSRVTTLANPQKRRTILDRVPLHRFGTADEMAGAVRYLVSPAAAYITGQTLLVDGGLTACGARGIGPN